MLTRFKRFVRECIRVFKITKKPGNVEFKIIIKVASIGMLIIGLIGFIINMIYQMITK